ncbi:MAG: iron-containing redox enzyme family protein [Gammaproteobacteria bacterium]|nr:iron-containing redox enzyme family protein [Gammaproteobacteria bacterium]NNC56084.1 hypothetical protein [Woeseiaceae bacterium]
MSQSNSEVLRSKIQLAEPRLQAVTARFWNHPRIEELFEKHLTRLYFTIQASKPLLESALQRSQELASQCPVAERLVPYLSEHIVEEEGHDEWVLDDLEVFGLDRGSVKAKIPPVDAATLTGSQYYYISHAHPVAVTAYQAVVEGSPPRTEFLDSVVARTSIPKKALGSFYKHAVIDKHHGKALWEMLDSLPLEPWHSTLLGMNAMLITDQIAGFLETVLATVAEPN